MERPARRFLKAKISDAENALEGSLAQGATGSDLIRHDEHLQTLDRLLQRFPAKKSPAWLLPLSVAVVAASLLGIAAAIRLPGPIITFDVRLSALAITAAADGSGLSSVAATSVKSLEVVGDAKAQAIAAPAVAVSSLKLTAGTTALVEQRASCFEIQILAPQGAARTGSEFGLHLVVLHQPKMHGQLPTPAELHASPGTTVTMCGDFPANYALAGTVGSIDLYRRQPGDALRGFVSMRTPSIISGKLRLPNVNRSSDLQDTDMLSFDGITRGWAFVFLAPAMRVVFAGEVETPESVSPTPEVRAASLEPTLLEWFTNSPLITSIFGLITGSVGMLWGLSKYFGFSAR